MVSRVESHSWHVDIQVDMCVFVLRCVFVCANIALHLGGE